MPTSLTSTAVYIFGSLLLLFNTKGTPQRLYLQVYTLRSWSL